VFAYFCRRCSRCKHGFILQLVLNPGTGEPVLPFDVPPGNTCPLCRAIFQPANYFVLQRSEPLGNTLGNNT